MQMHAQFQNKCINTLALDRPILFSKSCEVVLKTPHGKSPLEKDMQTFGHKSKEAEPEKCRK